ncbi:YidH family protein [Rossellomorea sp. NS-SX7]|uniref:YidH family protein n=1 Tax=Rossellomorea sp. NS-SX7 TaxID=3463856 RepID=UPI00405970F5
MLKETNESKYIQQHLANERTYLAWIRTSIAIIGIGFLTTSLHYTSPQENEFQGQITMLISVVSIVIGVFLIIGSTINYYRARKHINTQTFTSANAVIIFMSIVAMIISIFVCVYLYSLNV